MISKKNSITNKLRLGLIGAAGIIMMTACGSVNTTGTIDNKESSIEMPELEEIDEIKDHELLSVNINIGGEESKKFSMCSSIDLIEQQGLKVEDTQDCKDISRASTKYENINSDKGYDLTYKGNKVGYVYIDDSLGGNKEDLRILAITLTSEVSNSITLNYLGIETGLEAYRIESLYKRNTELKNYTTSNNTYYEIEGSFDYDGVNWLIEIETDDYEKFTTITFINNLLVNGKGEEINIEDLINKASNN